MNPRQVAEFTGVSHVTIIRWCKEGKILHEKKMLGKREVFDISQKEAARILMEKSGKVLEKDIREERKEQLIKKREEEEKIPTEERAIVGDKKLTRAEAERVIKEEDARKRQLDNLLREKEVIERSFVEEIYAEEHQSLIDALEELIDVWSLRERWTPDKTQEKRADMMIILNRYHRKLKDAI